MSTDTTAEIERRLAAALEPATITVEDDSASHVGHAGAASGGGHYNVRLVSSRFAGLSLVARHRLVYDPLSDLMRSAIHALAIEAVTPEEAAAAPAVSSTPAPDFPH